MGTESWLMPKQKARSSAWRVDGLTLCATSPHVPSSFLAIGVALLWDALERPLFEPLLLAFSVSFGLPVEAVALTIFFEQCASVENLVGVDSVERALPPYRPPQAGLRNKADMAGLRNMADMAGLRMARTHTTDADPHLAGGARKQRPLGEAEMADISFGRQFNFSPRPLPTPPPGARGAGG